MSGGYLIINDSPIIGNETPRCKQRGIYFASKIYSVASHGEFNPRTRLKKARQCDVDIHSLN